MNKVLEQQPVRRPSGSESKPVAKSAEVVAPKFAPPKIYRLHKRAHDKRHPSRDPFAVLPSDLAPLQELQGDALLRNLLRFAALSGDSLDGGAPRAGIQVVREKIVMLQYIQSARQHLVGE